MNSVDFAQVTLEECDVHKRTWSSLEPLLACACQTIKDDYTLTRRCKPQGFARTRMDQIFAPWRVPYIKSVERPAGCFLCQYAEDPPEKDAENLVLYRGEHAFVLLNRFPYTGGHLMIALNRHNVDFADVTEEETTETMRLARHTVRVLRRVMHCHGVNVGWNLGRCAGAGVVDHLHLHTVPRWDGDTNFVPVLSDVRVIPEALESVFNELVPHYRDLEL
jgi:ATP adenylyltransferase